MAMMRMLEQAPLPQLVENLGKAIAEAQLELDKVSIRSLKMLAEPQEGLIPNDDRKRSMLELGFTPSFYHFTEATITARVAFSTAVSMAFSFGAEVGGGYPGIFFASVNASYTAKYSFHAEGSSEVKTTIVSLPPPAPLNDLLMASVKGEGAA